MTLRFVALGVGDAFTERHYTSSLLVMGDGARLLVDFPDPPRKALREASLATGLDLRVETIDAAVLTHLHGDHVNGLESIAFFRQFRERRKLHLAAHPAVLADLWERRLVAAMGQLKGRNGATETLGMEHYFEITKLSVRRGVRVGPFTVEVRKTIHHIPTTALRITCGGRTLSYSADTSFDPSLIEWLARGSHRVVHETNRGIHTPYERLLDLPLALRRKMRLIHYPDDFDVRGSKIECLREGRVYRV